MKKIFAFVLFLSAGLLSWSVAWTQSSTAVSVLHGFNEQIVFGAQNVNHGSVRITTGVDEFAVPPLTFKVRACSTWLTGGVPLNTFTLTKGLTVYQGSQYLVDQEWVVTFPTDGIQAENTTSTYTLHSDVASYASASNADKQCYRMVLERAGIPSKEPVSGFFPIELTAKTVVRSKPTVTITPIGATTNRIRTTNDDVFRISVSANPGGNLILKELAPEIFGSAQQGGYFTVIDDANGEAVGRGWLSARANIAWEVFGEPNFGEVFVSAGTTRSFRIRVNSTLFQNNPGVQDALSMQIGFPCDVQWDTDFLNTFGPGLCLEQQVIPISATVSYE